MKEAKEPLCALRLSQEASEAVRDVHGKMGRKEGEWCGILLFDVDFGRQKPFRLHMLAVPEERESVYGFTSHGITVCVNAADAALLGGSYVVHYERRSEESGFSLRTEEFHRKFLELLGEIE